MKTCSGCNNLVEHLEKCPYCGEELSEESSSNYQEIQTKNENEHLNQSESISYNTSINTDSGMDGNTNKLKLISMLILVVLILMFIKDLFPHNWEYKVVEVGALPESMIVKDSIGNLLSVPLYYDEYGREIYYDEYWNEIDAFTDQSNKFQIDENGQLIYDDGLPVLKDSYNHDYRFNPYISSLFYLKNDQSDNFDALGSNGWELVDVIEVTNTEYSELENSSINGETSNVKTTELMFVYKREKSLFNSIRKSFENEEDVDY